MLFGVANRASSTGSSGQGPPQSSTCCQGLGKPAYNTPLSWVAPATRPSKLALAAALKNSRLNNPWFQSLSKVGVDPFVNPEADATPPSLPRNGVASVRQPRGRCHPAITSDEQSGRKHRIECQSVNANMQIVVTAQTVGKQAPGAASGE